MENIKPIGTEMWQRLWSWIKKKDNKDLVKMAEAALVTIIAGGWAVFTFVVDHQAPRGISATSGAAAAGHDANGNTITIRPLLPRLPKSDWLSLS
jgi:hypothetical protein